MSSPTLPPTGSVSPLTVQLPRETQPAEPSLPLPPPCQEEAQPTEIESQDQIDLGYHPAPPPLSPTVDHPELLLPNLVNFPELLMPAFPEVNGARITQITPDVALPMFSKGNEFRLAVNIEGTFD